MPFQMIARPLMERLEMVSGSVELEVLRPPTYERLEQRLKKSAEMAEPFDILHFDGHGGGGLASPSSLGVDDSENNINHGFLMFQTKHGAAHPVSALKLGRLLASSSIPLLVLNACRSAALNPQISPESAVALRLLQNGAAVVAMSYSVYAVAAAEFMTVFYETLFSGKVVSEAVLEGRKQLNHSNQRPSPKGMMALKDWFVPVYYTLKDLSFPTLRRADTKRRESLPEDLAKLRKEMKPEGLDEAAWNPLTPQECFLGRDAEFFEIENALHNRQAIIIHGVGGTGKTELAKAFACWQLCSNGLENSDQIFFHYFGNGEASSSLNGMLTLIGIKLFGPKFVKDYFKFNERKNAILEKLKQTRVLLIWDNCETIFSMHDSTQTTPPLDAEQLQEFKTFIDEVTQKTRSGLLIISRSPEIWMGKNLKRIEVGGLAPQDVALYTEYLLDNFMTAQKRRERKAYGVLLQYLSGHPLALRLILPHLETTEGELPPGFGEEEGQTESLRTCVHYSFCHLCEEDRRLQALTLFEGFVDIGVLAVLSELDETPMRFKGADNIEWERCLRRCVEVGLLREVLPSLFYIHPAFPSYIAALWREDAGESFDEESKAARIANIKAHALLGKFLLEETIEGKNTEVVMERISLKQRTLERVAGEALVQGMYTEAYSILQPLNSYWDARSLFEEAHAWVQRVRLQVEYDIIETKNINPDAENLWVFMVGSQANRYVSIH